MEQPLLVTAAIIEKDDKFLLIKRAREPFEGKWCFVGGCGSFKKFKNPVEAVSAEVVADIDCKFNPKFFMYNYENFETPSVILYFSGNIEGMPNFNKKYVSEMEWFTKEEVLSMDLGFCHKDVFRKYVGN